MNLIKFRKVSAKYSINIRLGGEATIIIIISNANLVGAGRGIVKNRHSLEYFMVKTRKIEYKNLYLFLSIGNSRICWLVICQNMPANKQKKKYWGLEL